jgi:hypothetical protein
MTSHTQGEEILLTYFGTKMIKQLSKKFEIGRVSFRGGTDRDSLMRIDRNELEAHFHELLDLGLIFYAL